MIRSTGQWPGTDCGGGCSGNINGKCVCLCGVCVVICGVVHVLCVACVVGLCRVCCVCVFVCVRVEVSKLDLLSSHVACMEKSVNLRQRPRVKIHALLKVPILRLHVTM